MEQRRPKILAIFEACPCGPAQGARIRAKGTLDLLEKVGEVTVILASRWTHDQDSLSKMRSSYNLAENISLKPRRLRMPDRIAHELSPSFLNTHNAEMDPNDRASLHRHILNADMVWSHSVVPLNAAGIFHLGKAVVDLDDLYSRFHASHVQQRSGLAKLNALRLAYIWRRRESRYLSRFSQLVVCSAEDKAYLGSDSRIHVLPNGFTPRVTAVDTPKFPNPTIGFVGNLKYHSNREGLEWFLRNAWPLIKQSQPACQMRVIGAGSDHFKDWQLPDVAFLDWIDNAEEEMMKWWVSVVPVFTGGGTRVKIATSFSLRCPVVATSLGAFGYQVESGRELLLGDDVDTFSNACIRLIRDRSFAERVAENASRLYSSSLTWDSMEPIVRKIVSQAVL